MFTMAKIKDGSTYLGHHLTQNDYYCEKETVSGTWSGKGAEQLGLQGKIQAGDHAFEALRNNRHPVTGERLTQRDGKDRICFYDFQCSAQKSVSVMAVTMGDHRLVEAHDAAVKIAFGELERFAATQENTPLARQNRITGNVIAAVFRHCAPTSSAAETLRQDGINLATTLSDFLQNVAIRNRPDLEQSVFIVDEAGLASNAQGAQILKLADECRARVIFFGDSRQHSSVEAGDFLRILEKHSPLHRVEVTDIRRQLQAGYREAVQLMALGASKAGLEKLDHLGCVKEGKAAYLDRAVNDFLEYAKNPSGLSRVIAVTPTWAENHAFTEQLRHRLKERNLLSPGERVSCLESLQWTRAQKSKTEHYQAGLVVQFYGRQKGFEQGKRYEVSRVEDRIVWLNTGKGEKRLLLRDGRFDVLRAKEQEVCAGERLLVLANDRKQGLVNGEVLSVRTIRDGVIETNEGKRIDTHTFSSLGYGYAVTSHKSQSKTVDHVIVAAERLDAKSAYVACSRGRLTCTVHTPDRANLFEHLPDGNRTAAVEAIRKTSDGAVRSPAESLTNLPAKADNHQRNTVDRWLHHELWRGLTEGLRNVWDRLGPGRSVDASPKKVGHENDRNLP